MKKHAVSSIIFCVVANLSLVACANPKNSSEQDEEKKPGCGCQSSENILDLRGTTENAPDGLLNPTAKL